MASVRLTANVKVNEAFLRKVASRLKETGEKIHTHTISVGIHSEDGAREKRDYDGNVHGHTVIEIAEVHEFGLNRLPQRSWLRSWFDSNLDRLKLECNEAMRQEYNGDKQAVPRLAGKWYIEIRHWIQNSEANLAPLAGYTVERRLKAGIPAEPPLFALGQLVESIRGMADGQPVSQY